MILKRKLIYLTLLFLLLLLSTSFAVVITPIDKEVTYEPEKEIMREESCGFNIKGSDNSRITFKVTGDLNNTVELEKEYIDTEENKWYTVNCIIKLNNSIKPGPHYVNILSIESPKSLGDLSAVAGVMYPIKIFIPYPGKYIEIKNFIAKDIEINKTQTFSINIISRGSERLEKLFATITITGTDGVVGSATSAPLSLTTGEEAIIPIPWDSTGVPAGQYNAKAIITYDEKKEITEVPFRIGDIRIDINEVSYDKIKINSIAKFNVKLQSYWNKEINDAYIIVTVFDTNNKQVEYTKSENFAISSWATLNKQVFLDTKNLQIGKYNANFTVMHSTGKSSEKQIEFNISKNYPITMLLLIIVIVLLLLIIIFNIKRLKNKDEKST